MKFFETSAKTNENIAECFYAIAKEIKESIEADKLYPHSNKGK